MGLYLSTRQHLLDTNGIRRITMTLRELTHKHHLISVQSVVDKTKVPRSTLQDWHRNKPQLLDIVLLGCAAKEDKHG